MPRVFLIGASLLLCTATSAQVRVHRHDGEIRACCQRRIPKSKYHANDLKKILKRLDAANRQ